ncbi:MAG: hypothetical protein AB9836_04750 [Aminipila sp.]
MNNEKLVLKGLQGGISEGRETVEQLTQIEPTIEVTEICPHCDNENTLNWNVATQGYEAECPVCGKKLMLCSVCMYDGNGKCDWDSTTASCYRSNI